MYILICIVSDAQVDIIRDYNVSKNRTGITFDQQSHDVAIHTWGEMTCDIDVEKH